MGEVNSGALHAPLTDEVLSIMRQRVRVLQLLDAAERAGITPIPAPRLHAFAYLADVLSPVWNLPPFDGKILKIKGGPHYPDLQRELDRLVVLGLVEVSNLRYLERPGGGARINGAYALQFQSPYLTGILSALGGTADSEPLDPKDRNMGARSGFTGLSAQLLRYRRPFPLVLTLLTATAIDPKRTRNRRRKLSSLTNPIAARYIRKR